MYEEEYKKGVQELRTGNIGNASKIFEDILIKDEKNERAWYALAKCTDDDATKALRLNNVLGLNPSNAHALNELEKINNKKRTTTEKVLTHENDTDSMKDIFAPLETSNHAKKPESDSNAQTKRAAPSLVYFFFLLSIFNICIAIPSFAGLTINYTRFGLIAGIIAVINASLFAAIGKIIDYLDQIAGHLKNIEAKHSNG